MAISDSQNGLLRLLAQQARDYRMYDRREIFSIPKDEIENIEKFDKGRPNMGSGRHILSDNMDLYVVCLEGDYAGTIKPARS